MRNCLICGRPESKHLCSKHGQDYRKCAHCSHVYLEDPKYGTLSTVPVADARNHHISTCKQEWDFSAFKAEKVFLPRLARIGKYVQPGFLLDIGCANGAFVNAANGAGWEGSGVELREASARIATSHGIKVFTKPLEELRLPEATYSAITMWQVLEHLEDPCRMLQECNRIMRVGGVLAFSTPNARSIGWMLLKEGWPAIDPGAHYNLFHARNIEDLCGKFGFAKCEINHLDLHPATIKQLKNKLLRRQDKIKNAAAVLVSQSSGRKLDAIFFFRKILNIPLDILSLGEDIYGYFRKISSC